MKYRCEATSAEAIVQLIAASYLRHGYYWYVTGHIPERKSPATVDRKLIDKYGIDVTEWQRARRRQQGLANAQYLRFGHWFIFLLTEGHHALRAPASKGGEGETLQDFRRVPLRFQGYSISYRQSGVVRTGGSPMKWRAHVRIDGDTYASPNICWQRWFRCLELVSPLVEGRDGAANRLTELGDGEGRIFKLS